MASSQYPNSYQQDIPYQHGPGSNVESYQLSPYNEAAVLSLQDFLGRVTQVRHSIRQLSADIERIGQLHQRSLSSVDGSVTSQLDALSAAVQQRAASIRDDLHALHVDRQRTNGASRLSSPRITKTKQIDQLKRDFSRALEDYRSREVAFRSRYRDQIARQYRVANPDATEEEIARAADEDWGSEGVFQAALRGHRAGQARSALTEVRARHHELVQIERTLAELAALFADVAAVVEQQDEVVEDVERDVGKAVEYLDDGIEQVRQATVSAKRAKRLKWWCVLVGILILLIVAVVILLLGKFVFRWF